MSSAEEREAALEEFDRSRHDFEQAVRRAPDAALRYKPAGEDYALGGLVVHVTDALTRYTAVLETIHASDWKESMATDHQTSVQDAELMRDGFDAVGRTHALDEMRATHAALADAIRAEPAEWFSRQVPVIYSADDAPHPTSPADIVGWMRDHYLEHTGQVADLVSDWAAATR